MPVIMTRGQKLRSGDIDPAIIEYIAINITSNIRELEGGLVKLGAVSSLTNTEITQELAKNDRAAAVVHLRSALQKNPDLGEARFLLGQALFDAGDGLAAEKELRKARASIAEGQTVAEPLSKSGVFPPMVVQMISVGESTGALDSMLSKIADFYDDEVDAAVAALTSLLEPAMMVFLGVTIGGMVIAMYLPIFKMASVIG